MVVIASDVDPIELVVWLPMLCRNKEVPYCFTKSKERLGRFVNLKKATCVALTDVRPEDKPELDRLANSFKNAYNNNKSSFSQIGDIVLGNKAQRRNEKRDKMQEAEVIKNA